ncbi:protein N-terminal glutamine amidohydrolase isoform X3 [Aristolochia californica]
MGVTDGEGRDLFAVFISNENRRIPLWHQKASSRTEGLILWDYHVLCIQRHGRGNALHQVWDLDTTLPFPVPLDQYVAEAVRPSLTLDSCFTRLFRVVHAPLFLRCFASDRRHMKNPNGHWMSPPPTYEPIIAEDGAIYNLDKYIQMSAKDVVTNTGDLVERIFSERFGVIMNEMQVEEFFSMLSNGNSS